MDAAKYTSILENKVSLDESKPTCQPEQSSFYWNYSKEKHVAYIPTENRDYYYNVEEYDAKDVEGCHISERWCKIKRMVNMSVSSESDQDQGIIHDMNALLKIMPTHCLHSRKDIPHGRWKHYILYKYNVNDIKNVPLNHRYEMANYSACLSITISEKSFQAAIDSFFEKVTQRFAEDPELQVYHYEHYPQ